MKNSINGSSTKVTVERLDNGNFKVTGTDRSAQEIEFEDFIDTADLYYVISPKSMSRVGGQVLKPQLAAPPKVPILFL